MVCGGCSGASHYFCTHVIEAIEQRKDIPLPPLCKSVTCPIVRPLIVPLDLGDPDQHRMRTVHPGGSTEFLGFVSYYEGRRELRDLVIAWLAGVYRTRPKCTNGCLRALWSPTSQIGLVDTYYLLTQELCSVCALKAADNDDDLIPT